VPKALKQLTAIKPYVVTGCLNRKRQDFPEHQPQGRCTTTTKTTHTGGRHNLLHPYRVVLSSKSSLQRRLRSLTGFSREPPSPSDPEGSRASQKTVVAWGPPPTVPRAL
jgi:hypothetical protein